MYYEGNSWSFQDIYKVNDIACDGSRTQGSAQGLNAPCLDVKVSAKMSKIDKFETLTALGLQPFPRCPHHSPPWEASFSAMG